MSHPGPGISAKHPLRLTSGIASSWRLKRLQRQDNGSAWLLGSVLGGCWFATAQAGCVSSMPRASCSGAAVASRKHAAGWVWGCCCCGCSGCGSSCSACCRCAVCVDAGLRASAGFRDCWIDCCGCSRPAARSCTSCYGSACSSCAEHACGWCATRRCACCCRSTEGAPSTSLPSAWLHKISVARMNTNPSQSHRH